MPILAMLALVPVCAADDWPHWRGPNRDGTTAESSRWDDGAWPVGEPAWTAQVGAGGCSPIVAGGRVYTLGWMDGLEVVSCLDADTGQVRWRRSYQAPDYGRHHSGDEGQYRGPSATPELDTRTGLLYTLGIDGDLSCWDAQGGGTPLWGTNLYESFDVGQRPDVGGGVRDYGYTTAPLVYGDWLIVEAGAEAGSLIAFDSRTGEVRWTSEAADPPGHSGGLVPLTVEDVPCVAIMTLHRLLVVRVDAGHEGETAAGFDWRTSFANSIPTPAALGDSVVLTSGYSQSRTARVRLGLGGAEMVWEWPRFSKVCSPVIHRGHVYFAWQRLRCLDWETGQQRWEGGSFGNDGSIVVTGDDRLIVLGNHRLALCETAARSPDAYTELAQLRQ
ncbi:MAG: PQQ-binding-like beta-propeller repeat protein [Armatimonadota bacterium]